MKQSRQKTSGFAFAIRQCCLTECVSLNVLVLNLVEQGLRRGVLNYHTPGAVPGIVGYSGVCLGLGRGGHAGWPALPALLRDHHDSLHGAVGPRRGGPARGCSLPRQ